MADTENSGRLTAEQAKFVEEMTQPLAEFAERLMQGALDVISEVSRGAAAVLGVAQAAASAPPPAGHRALDNLTHAAERYLTRLAESSPERAAELRRQLADAVDDAWDVLRPPGGDQMATHSPDDGQGGASGRDPNWPPPDDAMAEAIGAHLRKAWPEPFDSDEVFCEQVSFEASRAVLRHQMAAAVRTELSALIAQRPVTPGRPEDGPYPATLDEVADEVADWVRQLAPSLPGRVIERLQATTEETPEAGQ